VNARETFGGLSASGFDFVLAESIEETEIVTIDAE
jgi:hypothetical protein